MPNSIRYMAPLNLSESIVIDMQQLHMAKAHIV